MRTTACSDANIPAQWCETVLKQHQPERPPRPRLPNEPNSATSLVPGRVVPNEPIAALAPCPGRSPEFVPNEPNGGANPALSSATTRKIAPNEPKGDAITLILNRKFHRALLFFLAAALAFADTSLAQLGQGINAWNARDLPGAISKLHGVAAAQPRLADYAVYYLSSAEEQSGDSASALEELNRYRANPIPASPLAGKITLAYAKALLARRQPETNTKALEVLEADYKLLPQPDGDFTVGLAYEAQNEPQQAALAYQRVFYSYPNTDTAAQAWTALDHLRASLGADFPKPTAKQQLERCQKWLDAREYYKARQEYEQLSKSLDDSARDDAKVGMGAAIYLSGDSSGAFHYLKNLHVARSEADAERLYYLTEAARKTGDDAEMMDAVKQLGEHYDKSVWRLKALITAGNRYLLTNDRDKYTPLYKEASDTFPSDNSTAYCHWKVTWDAWLGDKPDRETLLREQIERYPDDTRASTALYFLGRLAEKNNKPAEARAWYERVSLQYPHYFYGVLARDRMKQPEAAAAVADETIKGWLDQIDWPKQRDLSASEATPATRLRIERSRLLTLAGLPDLAEAELRFGARTGNEQPALLAVELARTASSPFRALRLMKSFSGDYLALPIDRAPMKFWQMLFPLPYKDEVVRNARAHSLDPWQVAALIRQESEFNPGAKSHANAYGLMQVIPSTGRMMGRREGVRVRTTALFDPAMNIRLGTEYLRGQLDSWSGDWTQTLAAYNAGPGRVHEWLSWSNYREPAEFVESIPFSETREYVQAVLRNADMYRAIYGDRRAAEVEIPDTGDVPPTPPRVQTVSAPSSRPVVHRAVVTSSRSHTRTPVRRASSRASSHKVVAKRSTVRRSGKTVAGRRTRHKHEPA
jgi:soluble lytic murein transglycosylase